MAQLPPAGWYPDPVGEAAWRFWDGKVWTDEVPHTEQEQRSDSARSTTLLLIAIALSGVFGLWSLFAGMVPADACTPEACSDALIGLAYWLVWLGLPAAIVTGLTRIGRATVQHRRKAPTAARTLAVVVALIVAWVVLMRIGTPASMW